jgi:uncharacterized protein (TIGR03435 family)
VKSARPLGSRCGVPVALSDTALEPAVFGIWRPVLVVPAPIVDRLSQAELKCVFSHELCHVRRRDNLTGMIHMVVEALFWFHPLVWWLGARLVEERECACDEEVLRAGGDSLVYASGLVHASRFCIETPLPCVAGVAGGKLSDRVKRILHNSSPRDLGRAGRALLATAAVAALAAPLIIGIVNAPFARAQSPKGGETFDAVSIKPAPPARRGAGLVTDPGRITLLGLGLRECISVAYGVQTFQVMGANLPNDRYDITGTAPGHVSRVFDEHYETMLQAMLADRFQLRVHKETKTLPVFAMSIAKKGHKLKTSELPGLSTHSSHGHVTVTGATMLDWAKYLTRRLARPVVDATGLSGLYDFELDWVPGEADTALEPPDPDHKPDQSAGLNIFMAMEEQLGLKLQSKKLPVETVVVDRVAKPSAN